MLFYRRFTVRDEIHVYNTRRLEAFRISDLSAYS